MLSYELREHVLDYIHNRITLEALEDWYVPRLRQFLADPMSANAGVVAALEQAAVHLAEGLESEDEIREFLWDVLIEHSGYIQHHDGDRTEVVATTAVTAASTTSFSKGSTISGRFSSRHLTLPRVHITYSS